MYGTRRLVFYPNVSLIRLHLPAAKRHGLVEVFVVVLLGKTFFWVNFVVVLLGKTIFCFYDNFSCFLLERLFLYIVCIIKDANCKPGLKYFKMLGVAQDLDWI